MTRSLGDFSIKDFVVGTPFTTSIDMCDDDNFLILACDGLWDVVNDQDAVDFASKYDDAQQGAQMLLQHALENFSTDNTSVILVKFPKCN